MTQPPQVGVLALELPLRRQLLPDSLELTLDAQRRLEQAASKVKEHDVRGLDDQGQRYKVEVRLALLCQTRTPLAKLSRFLGVAESLIDTQQGIVEKCMVVSPQIEVRTTCAHIIGNQSRQEQVSTEICSTIVLETTMSLVIGP